VFFFIGDGMGIPQRASATAFVDQTLVMDTFEAQGITTTAGDAKCSTSPGHEEFSGD
jgi:hypothetical protein